MKSFILFILVLELRGNHGYSPLLIQPKPSRTASTFYRKNDEQDPPAIKPEVERKNRKFPIYKHMFRHYGDISFDCWLRCQDPESFLKSVGYTEKEVDHLSGSYPQLLTLDVHDQLAPKIRFLVTAMEGGTGQLNWEGSEHAHTVPVGHSLDEDEECIIEYGRNAFPVHSMRLLKSTKLAVPPSFYGCSLDRVVGPYHAYLESHGLPYGFQLLDNPGKLEDFLRASESPESFAALCQEWKDPGDATTHSTETLHEFQYGFTGGLLPASRDKASCNAVSLLLKHGYNPLENDSHGVGPLHWTAGAGNLKGAQAMVEALLQEEEAVSLLDLLQITREPKEGATPFHWACSGVTKDGGGGGGSLEICHWMMEQQTQVNDSSSVKELCNLPTWNCQSSPLMYAAWGGCLEICKLLVERGDANPLHSNARGETALHWAAAAGHLGVCQYLVQQRYKEVLKSPEQLEQGLTLQPDHQGQTSFDYAFEYGRNDVMHWMMQVL